MADAFQTAVANLRLACDEWPCHDRDKGPDDKKLDRVAPGTDDAFYMLAMLVFNLYRKFNYQWEALRNVDPAAIDDALLNQVRQDEEELRAIKQGAAGPDCPYADLARKLEEILIRQHMQNGPERDDLLFGAGGQPGA